MEVMAASEESISEGQEYTLNGEGKKGDNEAGRVRRGHIIKGLEIQCARQCEYFLVEDGKPLNDFMLE